MIPNIDPTVRFWLGVGLTIVTGISSGGLALKGALPEAWIPYITAWSSIIGFIGTAILTALNGAATTTSSRIASAAADPKVAKVVTTNEIANSPTFAADNKVTS